MIDKNLSKNPRPAPQQGKGLRGHTVSLVQDELGDFLTPRSTGIPQGRLLVLGPSGFRPKQSWSDLFADLSISMSARRALPRWWKALVAGHPAYAPGRDPGTYVGAEVCEPQEPAESRCARAIVLLGVAQYLPPARVMFNMGGVFHDSLSPYGARKTR